MPFIPSLPQQATLLDVFRKFPDTNRPLIEFHEALLRGPSPFTEAERELIAAYVSALNRCRYCRGVHTATAELLGVELGLVVKLVDDDDLMAAPEKMRPVLAYARKLTLAADSTTQSDADAVLNAGWNEEALYHLVATTALFNYMNRLVEGLGIGLNPTYVEPASKRLAGNGYLPLLRLMEGA
ncbi:MAG: peroxidase-related enzyme [Rhizobiaceae bacterium]